MVSSTGNRLIAPQSVFTATATNHISYRVADYARMRDFYMDLLGMRCVYDDGTIDIRLCLHPDSETFRINQRRASKNMPTPATKKPANCDKWMARTKLKPMNRKTAVT